MKSRDICLFLMVILSLTFPVPAGAGSLAGSEWGPGGQDQRYVQFSSGGKVSGHAGCNRFFSTYNQDGEELRLAEIATTRKMCSEAEMKLESEWLGLLGQVRSIEVTHLNLVLYDKNQARLIELKRRDFD